MFHDPDMTLAERRHLRDRREVQRRYAEERRRLVAECVRSFFATERGVEPEEPS